MSPVESTVGRRMAVHTFSLSVAGLLLCVVIAAQSFGFLSNRAELQLLTAIATFYLLVGSAELASLKVKDFWNNASYRESQGVEDEQRPLLDCSVPARTTRVLHP